jgi:hypothetical protein
MDCIHNKIMMLILLIRSLMCSRTAEFRSKLSPVKQYISIDIFGSRLTVTQTATVTVQLLDRITVSSSAGFSVGVAYFLVL